MPNEAFFKLDEEKRNKILAAMRKEFSSNTFEKASINKIVEDAGISKGSFWCYFESKEEAINFIVENYIELEKTKAIEFLNKYNGDIFKTYEELYDYIETKKLEEDKKELFSNIFKHLIINKEMVLRNFPRQPLLDALIKNESFNKSIDMSGLKINNHEELIMLLKLLNYSMRSNMMDGIMKVVTLEKARENFLKELEILKNGVLKAE